MYDCTFHCYNHVVKATFGLGCFWGPDDSFSKLPGVTKTIVGYCGGTQKNPTYEQVCGGKTGHSEVVQVEYDPQVTSFEKLLDHFWKRHNPTEEHKAQYKSVIFYHDEEQKKLAEDTKQRKQDELGEPIITEILPVPEFWKAEDYHQRWLAKQTLQ